MKRLYPREASKRGQKEESEEAIKRFPRITSFFHQENIAEQHNNENVNLHKETSTCDVDVSISKKELVSHEEKEGSSAAIQADGDADCLEKRVTIEWARCTCRCESYNNFDCEFCC
jgi:hypothetical protein